MIAWGSHLFRTRYRQVGECGQTAFRSAERSATGLSGLFRPPALSTGGKRGDNPANSRRRLRTWPKLRPGSSHCTSPKTSPLASLVGSHHPRPVWLTIRISPLPRRYFRLSFVFSFRSSFHVGGVRSSTFHVLADRTAVEFRLRNCCERCCYKRSIRSARSGS